MATFANGLLVKNSTGAMFLIDTAAKRSIPDAATLDALTVGLGAGLLVQVDDTALNTVPAGTAFPTLAAFIAANPLVVPVIRNAAKAIIPAAGLSALAGGIATIANAVANMYADAIANPANWGQRIQQIRAAGASAATTAAIKLLTQLVNKFINAAIQQFGGDPTTSEDNVDDAVDETGNAIAAGDDDKDDKEGDKEDDKDTTDAKDDTDAKNEKDGSKEGVKDDKEEDKDDKDDKDNTETQKNDKDEKDDTDQKNEKDDKDGKDGKDDPDQKNDADAQKDEKDDEDAGGGDDGGEDFEAKPSAAGTSKKAVTGGKTKGPSAQWESISA